MRRIGLLGGVSWKSTAIYYSLLNEGVRARLGGVHSADLIVRSLEENAVLTLLRAGEWDQMGAWLAQEAQSLIDAGCELVLLCSNTLHRVADALEYTCGEAFVHIADPSAIALKRRGVTRVGLLGTEHTMTEGFYTRRLRERYGLEIVTPEPTARKEVHRVIFDELILGHVLDDSRDFYRRVMQGLVARGADGILLGCTEIGMLVGPADATVPVIDSTRAHAEHALDLALAPLAASA